MIPVNADGRKAIRDLIAWHKQRDSDLEPYRPLFVSRKGGGNVAMTRGQAHKVLEAAFTKAGLNGKLATHSLRKSFAQRVYDGTNDIYLVQELLGHKNIETTKKYLGISYQKMQRAVEMIETSERHRMSLLYHSAEEIPDDTILIQAIKRGLVAPEAVILSQADFDELPLDDESAWEQFDAMTDEEAEAVEDKDNPHLTEDQLNQFKRTFYVKGVKVWEDDKTIGEWLAERGKIPTIIPVDDEIAEWFRSQGGDLKVKILTVLRDYVAAHR